MSRKRLAVITSALLIFSIGLASAFAIEMGEPAFYALAIAGAFFGMFGLFSWFQFDRQERGLRRSRTFNIGLASFAVVVAPVYLYRTRAPGRRLGAIALFFLAMIVGWQFLLLSGAIIGLVLKTLLIH